MPHPDYTWYTRGVKLDVARLTLPADAVRIAVVADTHSAPHRATAELLAARRPDAILHAGDIGDRAVIDDLAAIAPVHAIRGNIDPPGMFPDILELTIAGLRAMVVHIGVAGVRLRGEVARHARAAGSSLVICGHSHVPFIGVDRGLTIFNPGSCGPRRFQLPIVFGMLELANNRAKLGHVDCETGAAWAP